MQRIYPCEITPDEYAREEGHRRVAREPVCPNCGQAAALHRHGTYSRWITNLAGLVLAILIARFRCWKCGRTVSYLPSFALSYRLLHARIVQAWLDGERDRLEILRWAAHLRGYERRAQAFAPEVVRVVGHGLGLPPPRPSRLWPWLKGACGGLEPATRQLVGFFRITLFHRYQCHQPARL
jgi:ribosomal protein S27AE